MRIAFYAPLKPPTHAVPSGDRLVARLLMEALSRAGHNVELASTFRSFDAAGGAERQMAIRARGLEQARAIAEQCGARAPAERPQLWFTYHVYYKAPDWLGPAVSSALGIPYVVAEASYAPKRAVGQWVVGHEAAERAIRQAALVLSPTRDDLACLQTLVAEPTRVELLAPFLDPVPYQSAAFARETHRASLAAAQCLDTGLPWIVVAAMMRPGDKLESYRMLAAALERLQGERWQLVVAGDGPARDEARSVLEQAAPGRARFLGEQSPESLAQIYAACDLCVWPAVNEAYGMAMLEAQAAGLPVVSRAVRGVPDVVCDGRTGLLAEAGDDKMLSELTRTLLLDAEKRRRMGAAAAQFVRSERSIDAAALKLHAALGRALGIGPARLGGSWQARA